MGCSWGVCKRYQGFPSISTVWFGTLCHLLLPLFNSWLHFIQLSWLVVQLEGELWNWSFWKITFPSTSPLPYLSSSSVFLILQVLEVAKCGCGVQRQEKTVQDGKLLKQSQLVLTLSLSTASESLDCSQ